MINGYIGLLCTPGCHIGFNESHLTIDGLYEMACSINSSPFMCKFSRYVANITGNSAYGLK